MSTHDFMRDFRAYLIGSTEQVSDNLDDLSAQERWVRDTEIENDLPFILQAEEQMAIRDLKSAHQMFRFTTGSVKERYRVQVSDLIAQIRAIRYERAALGGMQ